MLFNSFEFAIFFAIVMGAVLSVPRPIEGRVLIAASLAFYALWIPSLLPLLVGLLGANYVLLRLMTSSPNPRRYLVASVGLTLAVLGVFKYGAFAVDLSSRLIPSIRGHQSALASLGLPLGISFYTFEIISLGVDVHEQRLECPTFGRYVLFVTFFPHLIAGPIMRGKELLPQLAAGGERNLARTRRGIWLFAAGLVKKACLSDYLLLPFVNDAFRIPEGHNGPVHLLAMYSFAFQIYFDFSGYADMARGLGCVLGFELPLNFEEPYLSRNPSEFWRRWHITLSRWLRDYLYLPLGGNRRGTARTQLNLMITMLLGGLWHGAGVHFIVWGGLHGLLLVAYRFGTKNRREDSKPLGWADVPRIVVFFHLICLIWIPFRAANLADTWAFWRGLGSGGYLHGWPIFPLAVVCSCAALHGLERYVRVRLPEIHEKIARAWWGPPVEGAFLGTVLVVAILASGASAQFIYFQF